jgi:hypothetical protein
MKTKLSTISYRLLGALLLSTTCFQLSAINASAQLAPTWKPRQKRPLEKYDMAPMYISGWKRHRE